jgi:hypothetical protein
MFVQKLKLVLKQNLFRVSKVTIILLKYGHIIVLMVVVYVQSMNLGLSLFFSTVFILKLIESLERNIIEVNKQ